MASYPPVQPRSLYRAIIRELRLSVSLPCLLFASGSFFFLSSSIASLSQDSIHTFRSHRTSGVLSTLRNAFRSSQSQFSSNEGKAQERQFVELAAYLRANRLHQVRQHTSVPLPIACLVAAYLSAESANAHPYHSIAHVCSCSSNGITQGWT